MNHSTRLLAAALTAATLTLTACATAPATSTAPAPAASTAVSSSPATSAGSPSTAGEPASAAGSYLQYADYEASGTTDPTVVLFFHASWCPTCRASEESLTTAGVPAGLTVVKVDYDSATELRQKYGITQQHTFVQVDGSGKELAKWTGSTTGEEILAKTTGQ